jgi:16S rRNA processing protein RimM
VNGSPTDWVTIALLGKTRGNRGEVTAVALSDKPERYEGLTEVHLFRKNSPAEGEKFAAEGEKFAVEEIWFHSGTLVFKLEGVDTITDAEALYGSEIRVPLSQRITLDAGEYFQSDLIGCEVVERSTGESVGVVTAWDDGGGSGLLVVNGELLVPFARTICVNIDPAAKRITVELPAGLRDLNHS